MTLGGGGSLFVGEDKNIILELVSKTSATTALDMTGWTMVFDVRNSDTSADPAIVTLTPTLSGTFNTVRSINTQRANVTLLDEVSSLLKARTYRWSWKRLDAGNDTVLAWGDFVLQKATAP